jgi:FkbM family methyltransferase
MDLRIFKYNNIDYYVVNNNDLSLDGCIREIVTNDEYLLKNFVSNEQLYILDIGANCGIATIILAKQNPNSIIYSFEPDSKVFNILKTNVELNNLKNVKLFNKAVTKKEDSKKMLMLHPECTGGNTTCASIKSLENYYNAKIQCIEVECISLDEIIETNNISTINLLKIDCEGAEYEILYNSNYFKSGIVENMVGEFHNLPYNNEVNSNTAALLHYCKPLVNGIFKITLLTL